MKRWTHITAVLKKLLLIVVAVVMLAACSNTEDAVVIGKVDTKDQDCMSCVILNLMYKAIGENVMLLHGEFTKAAMPIMMVAFSIWLALRLLKFVSSVTETNPGEVWNEILRKAAICLFCGILASSSSGLLYVINFLVFPVYLAFLELGLEILNMSFTSGEQEDFHVFGTFVVVHGIDMSCTVTGNTFATASEFPTAIGQAMECMVRVLSTYLTIGGDIAITVMKQVSNNLTSKIMGIILFLFFWVVKVGFSFYLVDAIFQMGIIILLLPLYILSYAFGPTRAWTKKGFGHVLASSAFMMCFSIITALVLIAMISLIKANPSIFTPTDLETNMQDISIGFVCLLLIGFLIYGSMGVSQELTSGLLGTGISANFQRNLKAAIQGIGGAILSGIGFVATFGVSLMAQSNIRMVKNVGKAIKNAQALRGKLQELAGRK